MDIHQGMSLASLEQLGGVHAQMVCTGAVAR